MGHRLGLHMRPADALAREASQFKSKTELVSAGIRIDAKSILDILTLGAKQGAQVSIEAEGEDAEQAVAAIAGLIESDLDPPADEAGQGGEAPGGHAPESHAHQA
ncbi:MAG: HPr family phosphocarrier protein [Planctomycetota bacterium]